MEYLALALMLIVCVGIGVLVGIFIGIGRMKHAIEERSVGYLRIDRSEPEEPPKPFLEVMGNSIESISNKDFIILKVLNENYLSRD